MSIWWWIVRTAICVGHNGHGLPQALRTHIRFFAISGENHFTWDLSNIATITE